MANSTYQGVADILSETIQRFSTRELIIVKIPDGDWLSSCLRKLTVLQNTGGGDFVWIDADSIASWNVDRIWDYFHEIPSYPLIQKHPNNPSKNLFHLSELGLKPSPIPAIHACLIAFQGRHQSFFSDCENWFQAFKERGWEANDEFFSNLQLNKIGAWQHLPTLAASKNQFDEWIAQSSCGMEISRETHLFFHGEKDPDEVRRRIRIMFKEHERRKSNLTTS